MPPQQIIIDTDPGQDDAIGILLALASPEELDVLGIVTVAGNVPLTLTSRNALILCELANKPETKVFAGCSRPLVRSLVTAEHVHGKTGLDGAELPSPSIALQKQHGVDWTIDTLLAAEDNSITICCFAPLTNVAMAMIKAPEILPKIRKIVMMGGGYFEGGNITPTAEFNIYVDPHAASTVLECGRPIVMLPLDVTHKALMQRKWLEDLKALGTPVGDAAYGMMSFYERFDLEKYGSGGGPLHDPTVIAYLLKPELFEGKKVNVEIEISSELTMGMTVVDWWSVTDRSPNLTYINQINAAGFFQLILERLSKL
ncbi:MAG: nucleoside hydrolase [SAR324 cluster bacterium]|nr:nucleoside hydrolase [SAR324 cluster bacterium]MBL7035839.1 nucleoside hydrolase [SAR324 cluster bacterium]